MKSHGDTSKSEGGAGGHAPRDAARKDTAGAAVLELIIEVAIVSKAWRSATVRCAAAKNGRAGARPPRKKHRQSGGG